MVMAGRDTIAGDVVGAVGVSFPLQLVINNDINNRMKLERNIVLVTRIEPSQAFTVLLAFLNISKTITD